MHPKAADLAAFRLKAPIRRPTFGNGRAHTSPDIPEGELGLSPPSGWRAGKEMRKKGDHPSQYRPRTLLPGERGRWQQAPGLPLRAIRDDAFRRLPHFGPLQQHDDHDDDDPKVARPVSPAMRARLTGVLEAIAAQPMSKMMFAVVWPRVTAQALSVRSHSQA